MLRSYLCHQRRQVLEQLQKAYTEEEKTIKELEVWFASIKEVIQETEILSKEKELLDDVLALLFLL